jgi:mRNA interferase MazF
MTASSVVQSDIFNPTHASITLCPITSYLVDATLFRLSLQPTEENGLEVLSQIMVDKITTVDTRTVRVGFTCVQRMLQRY